MNEQSQGASPSAGNSTARRPVQLRRLCGVSVGVIALGLLIWAKLQLVAGVPRTAVATPENDRRNDAPAAVQKDVTPTPAPEKSTDPKPQH